jgi:hypothetical protein
LNIGQPAEGDPDEQETGFQREMYSISDMHIEAQSVTTRSAGPTKLKQEHDRGRGSAGRPRWRFDPEVYLQLVVSGDGSLAQVGRDALSLSHTRQFVLIDSAQLCRGGRSSSAGSTRAAVVRVPWASLGSRPVMG